MADDSALYLIAGLLIGMPLGIVVGWLLANTVTAPSPASVVFQRDEQGRITEIHYVPGAKT